MNISWMKIFATFIGLLLWVGAGQAYSAEYEEVIYYHNDALGSPILATDQNGDVLWREEYSPYGSRLTHEARETDCSGPSCVQIESQWDEKNWYTGKFEETKVGLSYFGARWYDPELGRFISQDPVGFKEDNIQSFNRYAYANNNPYRYVDPDGRVAVQVVGAFIGGAIGAYNASQKQGATLRDIFVGGGIGAAVGVASTLGAGPLATAAFAGGSSAAGSAAQQAYDNGGSIDGKKVLVDGAKGAAFGAIAGKLGQILSPKVIKDPGISYTQGLLRPGQTARQLPRPATYGADKGAADAIDLTTGGALAGGDAYLSTRGNNQTEKKKQ